MSTDMSDTQPNEAEKTQPLPSLEETQASTSASEIEATQEAQIGREASLPPDASQRQWVLGAIAGLVLFIALGALGGVQSGINARQSRERLEKAVEAVAQFELGRADLEAGNCTIALQRFEYVIQLDPSYPGAADQLAQAMLCAGPDQQTPAAEVVVEGTPTPDLRSAEEILSQSQALLAAQNWEELLLGLDSLRTNYPDFEPIQVDDMYYIALRNRGVQRILAEGQLESGIFDLNRAEQIGPLDAEANNYRDWAILYVVGQSFWEVDWAQSVQYFSQLAAIAPSLHDVNFFTAEDRLAQAQVGYAQDLNKQAVFLAGSKGWCDAVALMEEAETYSPHPPEFEPTATYIQEKCELNPDETPRITPSGE